MNLPSIEKAVMWETEPALKELVTQNIHGLSNKMKRENQDQGEEDDK